MSYCLTSITIFQKNNKNYSIGYYVLVDIGRYQLFRNSAAPCSSLFFLIFVHATVRTVQRRNSVNFVIICPFCPRFCLLCPRFCPFCPRFCPLCPRLFPFCPIFCILSPIDSVQFVLDSVQFVLDSVQLVL